MKTFVLKSALLAALAIILSISAQAQTPPVITQQPAGTVAALGSPATLTVGVSGNNLTFQWLKDGVVLRGQTASSLSFGSFQFTNCGNYQLMASNSYGMALSLPAFLTTPNAPFFAWGLDVSGQLGNGTNTTGIGVPFNVTSNVVAMAAGLSHSLFVKSDNTLWAMGGNNYGQLGNRSFTSTYLPTCVASNAVAVAAGEFYSLFIKGDGSLWAMGDNLQGQLGIGTTVNTNVPVMVGTNFVAVAAGFEHSLLVKGDATLWTVGLNDSGQLGNGKTVNTNVPVCVASNVVAVTAGNEHSLFVKSDGTLWGMGANGGQLGLGSLNSNNKLFPVAIATNVVTAAAGNNFSFFIKSDGTLWGMGNGEEGELGLGSQSLSADSPVSVASNTVSVVAGYEDSFYVKNDGTLWDMGWNGNGQLGTNAPTYAFSPIRISGLMVASLGAMPSADQLLVVVLPLPTMSSTSSISAGFPQLNLHGGGLPGYPYVLQSTTNFTVPSAWVSLQTNVADSFGNCPFTVTNLTAPAAFFRIIFP